MAMTGVFINFEWCAGCPDRTRAPGHAVLVNERDTSHNLSNTADAFVQRGSSDEEA